MTIGINTTPDPVRGEDMPARSQWTGIPRNFGWTLGGQFLPVILGIATVPYLIHQMGVDRFGVLTIVWILVGYFGLFDLGIGRALTKVVAQELALGDVVNVATFSWTGLASMVALGCAAGGVLGGVGLTIGGELPHVPAFLHAELRDSILILALSLPFVTFSAGLRGVLEAAQRFDASALTRGLLAVTTYMGPAVAVTFTSGLTASVITIALGRVVVALAMLIVCLAIVPPVRKVAIRFSALKSLLSFGMWVTVSNLLGPVILYTDRFVIGSILTVAAVAYYATPYELSSRVLIVSTAMGAVVFPAFAAGSVNARSFSAVLLKRSVVSIFILTFPVTLAFMLFPREIVTFWLGAEFARHSSSVLQLLALGVLTNSLAQPPYAYIQASGRPDLTAKLHVIELAVYVPLLILLIASLGINGAAIGWSARAVLDMLVLFFLAARLVPEKSQDITPVLFVAATVGTLVIGLVFAPLALRIGAAIFILAVFSFITWRSLLSSADRAWAMRAWGRVWNHSAGRAG